MRAVEGSAPTDILRAAHRLDAVLGDPWPLAPPELEDRRARLAQLVRTRLIPLAEGVDGPILAVLAGSTGVGKSTLLNGLAGRMVSDASALRPTTTRPVAWCHPTHVGRLGARSFGGVVPVVVPDDRPELANLVVVDAPDFDSAAPGHKEVADALLAAADVVVFVSSPARFGDLEGWRRVLEGLGREVPMLHVLNRTDGAGVAAVRGTIPVRAASRSLLLDADEVIPVAEQELDPETLGPPHAAVHHILSLLVEIADEDAELARVHAMSGLSRDVAQRAKRIAEDLVGALPMVAAASAGVEGVVDRAVEPALPDAAFTTLRVPAMPLRRRRSGFVSEPMLHVVEDRLRVEVASAAAAMRAAWRTSLPPGLPGVSGLPDPDAVVRETWAAWVSRSTESPYEEGGEELLDAGWEEAVRNARRRLAAPYLDAAARSTPDLREITDAARVLGADG
ncbi:MAG: GTPase domain-containing protein [Acidimicrobiia bacterium]|nr:MAG: GTPase domain-containing protein [Acidimicrobiia bacterium]